MREFKIGEILNVDDIRGEVIGCIIYKNPEDDGKRWIEYRLKTNEGECWLSIDNEYKEYSVSWPLYLENGQIEDKWHKVDEGKQIVVECRGDVDVEPKETASFVEYEDSTEEEILSVEMWKEGTEISKGYYLDEDEIGTANSEKTNPKNSNAFTVGVGYFFLFLFIVHMVIPMISSLFTNLFGSSINIEKYLEKESMKYAYMTSITGKDKQKARVYQYYASQGQNEKNCTTDMVAKDIIEAIEGKTEVVTKNEEDKNDGSIGILTKKEYCFIYYPEGLKNTVYVQVSKRKYNYTSDQTPYLANSATGLWYRKHYYSSGFGKDSKKWSKTPSAYTMYDGPIIKDLGNGYFDIYSNNIRQESINRRRSDNGGYSSGK